MFKTLSQRMVWIGLLSLGGDPATRTVAALGTAQRNLSAAPLVGASFGDPEILVMTLVA